MLKSQRKTVFSWCLYDFANSFYVVLPSVLWQIYFRREIVGNAGGADDVWWGSIISTSMLAVAISSPMMGAIADLAGARKRLLIGYTLTCAAAVALFGTVKPGMLWWGFGITVLANFAFEGALVFYNAYLPEIAAKEYQGRISGWGFGTGYAGSTLGLLIALVLVRQGMYTTAWLTTAAAFVVFALPAFLWLPKDSAAKLTVLQAAAGGLREAARTFREILQYRPLRWFLLAYFFFEDGVNTVVYFAAAYASDTLHFTDEESLKLFLIVQLSALAGAFLWAKPTDMMGPKKVLLILLMQWSLVVTAAYFAQTKLQFFGIAVLAGSGLGAIQAGSRAFMASLTPRGREGDFFGFFSMCGKSAAILGPRLFGYVSNASGGNQRPAILSVMVLFIVGGIILTQTRAGGASTVEEN